MVEPSLACCAGWGHLVFALGSGEGRPVVAAGRLGILAAAFLPLHSPEAPGEERIQLGFVSRLYLPGFCADREEYHAGIWAAKFSIQRMGATSSPLMAFAFYGLRLPAGYSSSGSVLRNACQSAAGDANLVSGTGENRSSSSNLTLGRPMLHFTIRDLIWLISVWIAVAQLLPFFPIPGPLP